MGPLRASHRRSHHHNRPVLLFRLADWARHRHNTRVADSFRHAPPAGARLIALMSKLYQSVIDGQFYNWSTSRETGGICSDVHEFLQRAMA
jgi:hypothetical protein